MMKKKVVINGFGRIGRLVFRETFKSKEIDVIAVNVSGDITTSAHLLEFDSAQGTWMKGKIFIKNDNLIVNNKIIKVISERNPEKFPWKKLKIDLVIEATGAYRKLGNAQKHIKAGAKKVIISAPGVGDIKTIVYNVNHKILKGNEEVISAASCTTNCLVPIVHVLHKEFGLIKGFMTTVHSYTNDQKILDAKHVDLRRARAGAVNIIPTTTGAATAVGKVLPELEGKLDGIAIRVPTIAGSVVDLVCELKQKVTVEKINKAMKKATNVSFAYTEKPLVSSDVIGAYAGSIFDSLMTKVLDVDGKQLVKVVAWYDNEMSYVKQLIRTTEYFAKIMKK